MITPPPPPPPPTGIVLTTSNTNLRTSIFEPGAVLIQSTLQMTPADNAIALLGEACGFITFHTTMFGAEWPRPDSSHLKTVWPTHNSAYDFARLDQRVARAAQAGAKIIIHLGMGPTWMLPDRASASFVAADYNDGGVKEGQTNYSLDVAYQFITAANYDNFATMCGAIAARYAGQIWGYALWNENKGLWNGTRWRYEDMTTLYNKIWTKVKAADPAARMGGNYTSMPTGDKGSGNGFTAPAGAANVIEWTDEFTGKVKRIDSRGLDGLLYWRDHALGYDFVCHDGLRYLAPYTGPWFRAQFGPSVQVVNMEQYSAYPSGFLHPEVTGTETAVANALVEQRRALFVENYRRACVDGSYVTSCMWTPQQGVVSTMPEQPVFTASQTRTTTTTWLGWLKTHFGIGKVLKVTTTNDPLVTIIATAVKVMVGNRYEVAKSVTIDGVVKTIPANSWALYDRPVV